MNKHTGKVAKCKHGKVGVITNYSTSYVYGKLTHTWIGISLKGRRWQSKDPEIIAENLDEYIERRERSAKISVRKY